MPYAHNNLWLRKYLLGIRRRFSQPIPNHNSFEYLYFPKKTIMFELTEKKILWLAHKTQELGCMNIFNKFNGKIGSENKTFFETIKIVSPILLQNPPIHKETRTLINIYMRKSNILDLKRLLNRLQVANKLSSLILDSVEHKLKSREINKLIKALILWFKGFRHIQSKRPDAKMRPEKEFEYISLLARSNKTRPAYVTYYFTLFKSSNPLRTGGINKIDLAELEFFRTQSYPAIIGNVLGIPLRWIAVNEASETAILDGVSQDVINYNLKTVKKYLKLIKADHFFEFRSIRSDIRMYLDNFEELYKEALKQVTVPEAHIRNFIFFPSPKFFESKSISKKEIDKILVSSVSGKLTGVSKNIYRIAHDNARVLLAIKAAKIMAETTKTFNEAHCPPQYSKDIINATLIRDPKRFSIVSQSDFAGKSRLPNYGMAIYCRGKYLGELYFWEIISNIDLFKAHIAENRIVAFELIT